MHVIVKCRIPDYFENGDHALIELSEDLILTLDKRVTAAKRNWEEQFHGMEWWDYTPDFLTMTPDDAEMEEEEFDHVLEGNGYILLPETFDPAKHEPFTRIDYAILTVCANQQANGVGGEFYWTGTEKHTGAQMESYTLPECVIDEWAELIGFTEKLRQVRRAQGR